MRYHYIPTRIAKMKNTDDTKYWQRYGPTVPLKEQPLWETSGIP